MLGVILEFNSQTGEGLISGEDDRRYGFAQADVQNPDALTAGARVDFIVGEDQRARDIYVLTGQPRSARLGGTGTGLHGLAPDHKSMRYGLNPFQFFWKCITLYFSGYGRATVAEYWSFQLVLWGGAIIFVALVEAARLQSESLAGVVSGVFFVFFLGLIIPGITVTIRRLHDIGISGWFYLISLIPYLGGLIVFAMTLVPSQKRANQYGPYFRDVIEGRDGLAEVFE